MVLILPPDPFKLVGGDEMDEELGGGFQSNLVHIRLQQRTGRKTLTTVQGLADVFDKKKVDAVPVHILRRQSVVSMSTLSSNWTQSPAGKVHRNCCHDIYLRSRSLCCCAFL
jgi:hypothetical protein